jgi:SAM-dependent methyltransferase
MADEYAGAAEFYDYVVPYATREDVQFFVDEARAAKGPVLEVGCGSGRVLIPTARAGVAITGLDLSPAMLELCRTKLRAEPPDVQSRVDLHQGDMTAFDLRRKFALITLPFRPFQHLLTVDAQVACLTCIGVEMPEGPPFTMPDGRHVVRTFKIPNQDRFTQVNDIELIYNVTTDGRSERHVHAFKMRYLFRFEAEHLLARCGFVVDQLYAGYDRSSYGSTYPGELIFVARKAS